MLQGSYPGEPMRVLFFYNQNPALLQEGNGSIVFPFLSLMNLPESQEKKHLAGFPDDISQRHGTETPAVLACFSVVAIQEYAAVRDLAGLSVVECDSLLAGCSCKAEKGNGGFSGSSELRKPVPIKVSAMSWKRSFDL